MSCNNTKLDLLPSEIILAIAEKSDNTGDINALVLTSRRFFETLNEYLYRHNAIFEDMDALSWAAREGRPATAQLAMNARSFNESHMFIIQEALYDAAEHGHLEIVTCIIKKEGLDPNFKTTTVTPGITALYQAVQKGHTDIVKALLSVNGIDPNPKSNSCEWPLATAAFRGHVGIVDALLDFPGIEVDYRNRRDRSRSPLYYAVLSKSPETVACFLRRENLGLDVNIKVLNRGGRTAFTNPRSIDTTLLISACLFRSIGIVKELLAAPSIDINLTDYHRHTALHFAAELGEEEIVRLLLEHGADPDPKDHENETPLFLASKNGSVSIVKMLLDAGADSNHTCDNKVHPLGAARTEGHTEVVELLHSFGQLDLDSLGPVPRNWNAYRGSMWRDKAERNKKS